MIQQLRIDQLSQLTLQGRVIECRKLLHQRVGKLPPDHRPELRRAFGASQPIQPRHQGVMEGDRNRQR